MGFNIKSIDVTVPFNLIDLNGDSNFKDFVDFINGIKEISKTSENLCTIIDQNVSIKDTVAYNELISLRRKNHGVDDSELLKKEKEIVSNNIYEATVSILYDIKSDDLVIRKYADLQKKLLSRNAISRFKIRNFDDPKRILLDYSLDLKNHNVDTIFISSVKTKNGYKTNFSYSVPLGKEEYFKAYSNGIRKKLESNYDYSKEDSKKEEYKGNNNISFDTTFKNKKADGEQGYINSIDIDESKFSDGPISTAKRERIIDDSRKGFISVNDEVKKFFINCTYNGCESVSINSVIEDNAYNILLCLRVKEIDLDKFTSIIEECSNNFENNDFLTERINHEPEKGVMKIVIGITEPREYKPVQTK